MASLVKPKVFLVGYTAADVGGIEEYLRYTKQEDFLETWKQAMDEGISTGEALCSLFAKMCYKSVVLGKNTNVSRIRDIRKNLEGCHDTGHGSVFEHCQLNFIVTNCSRVYTHEQVRHRVGFAYSQTSGRYCRLDSIDLVWSDLLDPVKGLWLDHLHKTEELVYLSECRLGLRKPPFGLSKDFCRELYYQPDWLAAGQTLWSVIDRLPPADAQRLRGLTQDGVYYPRTTVDDYNWLIGLVRWVPDAGFDFDRRKAITSAIRRIAPNGQSNEIGMSCNIRALRHTVQLRTQRFAETEIRDVWGQIYCLVKARFPTMFYRAKEYMHDNLLEIRGMKMQPYEIEAGDPEALRFYTVDQLHAEIAKRGTAA